MATAKERRSARAKALLDGLPPFDKWVRAMSDAKRASIITTFGSVEAAYESIKGAMEREYRDPSPTSFTISKNGTVKQGWK